MDHPTHLEAVAHLRRADPVMDALIDRVGRAMPGPRVEGTHLGALARAIVFQQLSGRAAGTIHGRFEGLFGGRAPAATELLSVSDDRLRAVGLSRAKARYLKDLAQRAAEGTLPVDSLHELDDVALLAALTGVKGIGRWTAQMFLLFRLGRPDVLPDLDLGVRRGIQLAYGLRQLPTPKEVLERGAPWSPYASFAAWYLWRSLELPDVIAAAKRSRAPRKTSSTRKTKRSVSGRAQAKKRLKRRTTSKRPSHGSPGVRQRRKKASKKRSTR
jgi:DNA-3-methyladenine glycosylase II